MKTVVLISLVLIFSGLHVFAQKLSRKEQKDWKKKAQVYVKKPAVLKKLMEDKDLLEIELDSMTQRADRFERQVNERSTQIASLDGQVTRMRIELASAQSELAQLRKNPAQSTAVATKSGAESDFNTGIIFRIQIGAFRNPDLSKYFSNNPNFFGEAAPKGEQKATIGVFRDYSEADQFKKYMRSMGVRDAWIVPFRDGQRVELKDVLSSIANPS